MRKKKLLYLIITLVLMSGICWVLRYPVVFRFQYARLRFLKCAGPRNSSEDCLQKLWVHRVNSLKRYDILRDKFTGFETDIYFDDSSLTFSVYHPPRPPEGDTLSLSRFLAHIDLDRKRLWLDTRNVDSSNAPAAIAALERTGKSVAIKKACIVELYDAIAAEQFSRKGYLVSFDIKEVSPNEMDNDISYRDSLESRLKLVEYVSAESSALPLLKRLFPSKKIILWHVTFIDYFRLSRIQKILDDPQVAVILLNVKSSNYR